MEIKINIMNAFFKFPYQCYDAFHYNAMTNSTALSSEGSVKLSIDNKAKLMGPQKAGKPLAIKCDLDLVNVRQISHLKFCYLFGTNVMFKFHTITPHMLLTTRLHNHKDDPLKGEARGS